MLARPDDVDDLSGALTKILENPDLAARLARGGLQRARESFDPGEMVDRYEQLFADVTARRNARQG